MPTPRTVRECGDENVEAGRGPGQLEWYRFALRFVRGKSVLDVGAGLGDGLRILRQEASLGEGQDLDERLAARGVRIGPIDDIPDRSYDVVTSVDVIEHIEDDGAFVASLARIARQGMFLTTPNWTASRCAWPYHIREYTPRQLENLLSPLGRVTLFKGLPSGATVYPVKHPAAFHALNALRSSPMTAFMTQCLNRVLPEPSKIHSHLGAWVEIDRRS